ncbi:RIP metalloprotease RseP [Sulfitobacter guttiformis]|uniref:Zinc metalloprotease n=1 Tax=Sulfitobacter guttiformis TaxID=74349 RepID=A0A420DIA6_9RHOB|nr:RIP metalloprotease RseP [Sulfitobacter guttiformis]KIN72274.1 Peptidase M50 family protein [Sulfitobacter guttiformis KCTC 32187]RKE93960.1 regulator of sigma E protease [Sulfitobacter guttiformis]
MDITTLIPQFGGFVWTLVAFVIALSVIVAIHEYGHYIVGRWCGIRADVFSLGFGPVLYSRFDKRGTKWQIALLPFGGYVKFAGDANAASGKDEDAMAQVATDPARLRETMHGAPLWARALTVVAGPVFNFALSILVFAGVGLTIGTVSEPLTVAAVKPLPVTVEGLEPGDVLQAIAGREIPASTQTPEYREFMDALPLEPVLDYSVLRNGVSLTVDGPYPNPALVGGVGPQTAALEAGLVSGDVIVGIDGVPTFAFQQLKEAVESSEGRPLLLDVWRAGEVLKFTLVPKSTDEPQADGSFVNVLRIGISSDSAITPATETPSLLEAAERGIAGTWRIIKGSLSGMWHMVTGAISSCNMSGPVGIAKVSGAMASQGALSFINFIAVLSTAVGLLNLFPIPALDGGHLMFYAYEAVTGKPPSDKALRVLMTIGISMVLGLMLFALFNDFFCP